MPAILSGKRVLVVEDHLLIALGIAQELEALSCTIIGPAGHVMDALALIRESPLHGATVDYDLHGEKCRPVLDELRDRGIPTLIVTAYHSSALKNHGHLFAILDKPFHPKELQKRAAMLFRGTL